ncbi:FecR family protein [Chitinophaga solisilvae]|uniref:FecR family protein n=1 Tax=Chitinophaga solisilvae TaxID=1233460 RepID=UPI00136F21F1|nr:FecR domain-containing protein [Chitinophaga solisilvae]
MNTSDKNIDWDKILSVLEEGAEAPLNEEEAAVLRNFAEMKERVQSAGRFPAEDGWQRFTAARDARTPKVRYIKRIAVAAGIAALITGAGIWFSRQQVHTVTPAASQALAVLPPAAGIQLRLANGSVMALDSTSPVTQNNNGTQVKMNNDGLVYEAGNNTKAVTQPDTLVVPLGNSIRVSLPDGTGMWVNADSRVIFPAAFNGPSREVWVEGEAYLEVAARPQQPFIVHAAGMDVKVLGTAFNINTRHITVQATLSSGKVSAVAGAGNMLLSPGEQAEWNRSTGSLQRRKVEVRRYTAWKDNELYFEEAPLSEILTSLGRSYDYTFTYGDNTLQQLDFTLDMSRPENLQQVLDQISRTNRELHFKIYGRVIVVSRQPK